MPITEEEIREWWLEAMNEIFPEDEKEAKRYYLGEGDEEE